MIHHGPRRDVTIATANGLLTCDSRDWLVGKHLFLNREYELYYMRKTVETLRGLGVLGDANGTVFDVGANIGMICIPLVRDGLFRRAVAFEPDPNNFRLLEKNVVQNGLAGRVLPLPYALSSGAGEVDLELSPDNYGDHRIRLSSEPGFYREQSRETRRVRTETLDGVARAEPAVAEEAPALVWLDIQGHEGHFFEGARETLRRGVPVVSEFWPYGIERSGMSRERYCEVAGSLFTSFFTFEGEQVVEHDIEQLAGQFDCFDGPRQVGQLIFLNREAAGA
jgi:FkbM family methyltransferase